jgi:hypothetical protein
MTNKNKLALLATVLLCGFAFAEEPAAQSAADKLTAAAMNHRLALDFDGEIFSGAGWQALVEEGAAAQFFLIGEEHGIAENPKFVAQLFNELSAHGYSRMAIEISPTMAALIDDTLAAGGLDGLRDLYARPGGEPAFYGMAEEAEMLAAVRASAPADQQVLWGTDYEVASDRQLIQLLGQKDKPPAAATALAAVATASAQMWAHYEETGSPQFIFSFAGDPGLIRAVSDAWPDPDPGSAVMLNTLEKTLTINNLWLQGKAWESNKARAELQRENFLRYWRVAREQGEAPRIIAKYGSSHIVRGLSPTAVFDLGTLLPEIAALEGGQSLSLMVMPGAGTEIAGLNPATWSYEPRSADGGYIKGVKPLMDAAFEDKFTLIDLRALRAVAGMKRGDLGDEVFRVIHGFDMLLVMSGSTPAGELTHD